MTGGDFLGDDLSGVHTCHAECPCHADRSPAPTEQGEGKNYPPDRILICPASGDWIPESDGPECPHAECAGEWGDDPCRPVLFVRSSEPSLPADQVTVNRADLADLTDAVLSRRFAGVNGPLERLRAVLNQEDK